MINLVAMGSGRRKHNSNYRRYLSSTIAGAILMFGIGSPAHAIPITLEFTVTDIPPTSLAQLPPPVDTISGVIVYEAEAVGATIDALTSISLDIGSDSYTLSEVSFLSPFGISSLDMIGGTIAGVEAITTHTMDFSLMFDRVAGTGVEFKFASTEAFGIWEATNFSQFSLNTVSVAEPPVLSLLVPSLAGALVMLHRNRRRMTERLS